jgi:hypothetical protein
MVESRAIEGYFEHGVAVTVVGYLFFPFGV